jgi:hypothetical protein
METVVILIMACATGNSTNGTDLNITAKAYKGEAICKSVGQKLLEENQNKCSLGINVSCGRVDVE